MANVLTALQNIIVPTTGLGIKVGTITGRGSGTVIVKAAYSGNEITLFSNIGVVGDTVLFQNNQLVGIIAHEEIETVDIP